MSGVWTKSSGVGVHTAGIRIQGWWILPKGTTPSLLSGLAMGGWGPERHQAVTSIPYKPRQERAPFCTSPVRCAASFLNEKRSGKKLSVTPAFALCCWFSWNNTNGKRTTEFQKAEYPGYFFSPERRKRILKGEGSSESLLLHILCMPCST